MEWRYRYYFYLENGEIMQLRGLQNRAVWGRVNSVVRRLNNCLEYKITRSFEVFSYPYFIEM